MVMISPLLRFPLVAVLVGLATVGRAAGGERRSLAEAIILSAQAGGEREDLEIRRWQAQAQTGGAKADNFEKLGWAYVAKARRTLDVGYYKLAEKTADVMDARFGASPEARLLRGHVFHQLHRFAEAEALARALVAERGLAPDYALLCDALMEQGKLAPAVEACQRLVDLRPGVEAYSRIAHLRWLKGDVAGATAMMETAERAASQRDPEGRAWLQVRLSGLALQSGDLPRALALAESAIGVVGSYPPALLARGRALLALGHAAEAAEVLSQAARLNPLPEYQWWQADALRLAGNEAAAAEAEQTLRERGGVADPRTLALFLATRNESIPKALRWAREESANREDSLTYDALAWALLAAGETGAARVASDRALAEGVRDARLLWHSGEIALASGDREAAERAFQAARPHAATLTPSERARLDRRLEGRLAQSP